MCNHVREDFTGSYLNPERTVGDFCWLKLRFVVVFVFCRLHSDGKKCCLLNMCKEPTVLLQRLFLESLLSDYTSYLFM
jgi:hypothetical protein